jgi:YidC/Oxa1 family membrane protein insertase
MDKNTLLAVVLSVIVISVGFYIQSTFFMPPVEERSGGAASQDGGGGDAGQTKAAGQAETTAQSAQGGAAEKSTGADGAEEAPTETIRIAPGASSNIRPHGEDPVQQEVRVENEVFIVNFSSRGAVATSIKLKDHLEEGRPLEMVQNEGSGLGAFGIAFGEAYDGYTDASFHVRRIDDLTVEFYRDFSVPSTEGRPVPFTLTKRFSFKPRDYLIELRVGVKNSINAYPPLDFDGYAYTLSYGPEIGPAIEELDGRYEYRRFYSFGDGKRNKLKVKGDELITERVSWIALLGKYFTVIGIPDATKYDITASEKTIDGMKHSHQLFFSRPLIKSSVNEDIFQFYAGPKLNRVLTRYNDPDSNGFGTSDLQLEEVMDTGSILGWLEWLLKKLLMFFHSLVPNWGVAIILMTIAIKIILFPITHKSYESTSRMQSLNPKIQEIRSQYKDNPQKMNQEMAALYKTEGVNPLGGCLPLLLQMPIFIALYGLLNKHFDLRGAVFIQGWISDLSSPESIFSLPFQIPIVGWTDIRLLPIIFALTMLISSKMMQSPATSSQGNMKMIMYFMPLFLFFVLYDAPSGLLVYWIMTNFLTVIQQKVIGKRQMAHDAAGDDSGGGGGSGASGDGGGRPKAAAKTGPGGGKAKNNRSYRDEVNRRYAIAKQNRTKKKKKR